MRRQSLLLFLIVCLLFCGQLATATSGDDLADVEAMLDSLKSIEANVYSPKAFTKALENMESMRTAVTGGKKKSVIDKYKNRFHEQAENAAKATGVCKLTLSEYIGPRQKAVDAGAAKFVPAMWAEAEKQFTKATAKIEGGDTKNGLKEAGKATPLYDKVEMAAIRMDIFGKADALIEKAVADDAEKYAAMTLDKARTARTKSNSILTADRYERDQSLAMATLAEHQARHASYVAQTVRSQKRNDQAWERLMLVYEIEMDRIAEALGIEMLLFNNGPTAATDSLINSIKEMQTENKTDQENLNKTLSDLAGSLRHSLSRTGKTPETDDPIVLARMLDEDFRDLLIDRDGLANEVSARQDDLDQLTEEHELVSGELDKRLEKEEKIKTARSTLNPSECEVLLSASDDIVLRLFGLSFDVGSSDIRDDHVPLLKKVEGIIQMFPESRLMIEGHTDNKGDLSTNKRLSENRAYSVMRYLRQSLSIPAERIQSTGYGPDKPIATNQTKEGRAKNRRIDIIILQ